MSAPGIRGTRYLSPVRWTARRYVRCPPNSAGFTLLEVLIALAILGMSLGVLLETQVTSLNNAGRARHLTIGALLLRSKMIDIEQELFDKGFTLGDQEDSGDFTDEGHPEIKWKSKVSEVELSLDSLGSMAEKHDDDDSMGVQGILGGMSGAMSGFIEELGHSIRVVTLTITWPDGKYSESASVRALLTREDLGLGPATPNPALGP
jgi:prepilin-type N-terminal cleavage/methylation domain-containing protein